VVGELDPELAVQLRLVGRRGVGEDGDDVAQVPNECLDLLACERAARNVAAQLSLESLAFLLRVGDPGDEGPTSSVSSRPFLYFSMRRSQSRILDSMSAARAAYSGSGSLSPASAAQVWSMWSSAKISATQRSRAGTMVSSLT